MRIRARVVALEYSTNDAASRNRSIVNHMNNIHHTVRSFVAAACMLTTAACGTAQPVDQAPAAVESYLQARVAGNAEQMIALSCSDWEAKARIEASTFQSMKAELEGVACTVDSSTSGEAAIQCTGRIVTSYNGESREWRLDERAFRTVLEGGEWRMCGYR